MTLGLDWNLFKGILVLLTLISTLFLLLFSSKYQRFNLDEFVIHLRYGRIWREGTGGHAVLMPFIDKIITIPLGKLGTIVEQTNFHGGTILVDTSHPLDEVLLSSRTRRLNDEYVKGVPIEIVEFEDDICVVEKVLTIHDER